MLGDGRKHVACGKQLKTYRLGDPSILPHGQAVM